MVFLSYLNKVHSLIDGHKIFRDADDVDIEPMTATRWLELPASSHANSTLSNSVLDLKNQQLRPIEM